MRWWLPALAVAAVLGAPSCRRPLGQAHDAGDGGASIGDAAHADVAPGDAVYDAVADFAAGDLGVESAADVAHEVGVDAPPAICPAGVAPLDVCGCGCCGPGPPGARECYYPSLGQSRETVPNPMPTPQQCATTGCSEGDRFLCCADPGPQPAPTAVFCGVNASGEDLPLFAFSKRDGDVCTTIEIGITSGRLSQISTPFGPGVAIAWRGPCDGSSGPNAIGGIGRVTARPAATGETHYDVHVALFFDSGTGVADVTRIDVDDIYAAVCPSTGCTPCGGTCAFDTTYRFGYTGGRVVSVDTVILSPPASYQHVRSPTSMTTNNISCAPPPPACGGSGIDVGDIMAAFADADVRAAIARSKTAGTYPFYGSDPRPTDGSAFQLTLDGGGGFLMGGPCPAGSTPPSCMEIPGGLDRLRALLIAFDQQQLRSGDPACQPLLPSR